MNIIKLKDIVMTEECSFTTFFNENLKGKYAYWVKMRYIFPLDSIDYRTYIQYEQFDKKDLSNATTPKYIDLCSQECCMLNFSQKYIDLEVTNNTNINEIHEYSVLNEYTADFDINIDKLRNFRSWLANELLTLNAGEDNISLGKLSEAQIHVFNFYKNNMYNDIVKQLNMIGNEVSLTQENPSNKLSCSCCNTNIAGLYNITDYTMYNVVDIYIKNLHNIMVRAFEDINFWLQFDKNFIKLFKKYIDNIIKTGLLIKEKESLELYVKCNCNKSTDSTTIILKNLSDSLQYIIDNDINGHMNFIHDSLYEWANQMYDKMSWNIR